MSDKRDRRTAAINLLIQHIHGFQLWLGITEPELHAEMGSMCDRLEEIRKMPDEEQDAALKGLTERFKDVTI